MLINRNRRPRINIFKDEHVSDSYVSKSETEGVINEVDSKLKNHSKMINENFGFDHCSGPREVVRKITTGSYRRFPMVENFEPKTDSSLLDQMNEDLVSFDISNDIIGKITKDETTVNESKMFKGVENELYSKVSYGSNSYNLTTYSPFSNLSLTDVVKSFIINDLLYSVHRGGYISITMIKEDIGEENITRNINLIDNSLLMEPVKNKSNVYFSNFEMGNLVTNVSKTNDIIIICTTNKIILFDIDDESVDIIDSFNTNGAIIAMEVIDSSIYTISSSDDLNFEIKKFDIYSNETITFSPLNYIDGFFPNTITQIGDDVIVYENSRKFGKHSLKNIAFMILNDTPTIKNIELSVDVETVFITGSDINKLCVGLKSDTEFLNKSIVIINDLNSVDYYQINKGAFSSILNTNIDAIFKNNFLILSYGDKNIEVIKFDNQLNSTSSCILNICGNRNTCEKFTDISLCEDDVIVTFEDNTHGIYSLETLNKFLNKNIKISYNRNSIEFKINSKIVILDNNNIYILDSTNLLGMRVEDYSSIYSDQEFNNIECLGWYINDTDTINTTFVTKSGDFTRVSMISINHSDDDSSVSLLNNMVWNETITRCSSDMIRIKDDKIFIPFGSSSSNNTCLVVCDFNKNIVIRNVITTSDYNKSLFLNDDCTKLSIGIDDKVYIQSLPENFHTTESDTNITNDIEESIFTNDYLNNIDSSNVLLNYAFFNDDDDSFETQLLTLNNNSIRNKLVRTIKSGDVIVSICSNFIKLYNSTNKNLINIYINNFEENIDIVSITSISSNTIALNMKSGSIIINKTNEPETNSNVLFFNKNIKYVKNGENYLVYDNNILSLINISTQSKVDDILNELRLDTKQFSLNAHKIIPNTVDSFNNKIYITVSIFSRNSNALYGNGLIIIDEGVTFEYLNYDEDSAETQMSKILTNYTDTVIIDDKLHILYYNSGKIHCKIINNDSTTTSLNNVYQISNGELFLGMIARADGIYVLDNYLSISSTSYTSKTSVTYTYPDPLDVNYYKVLRRGKNDFYIFEVGEDNIYNCRRSISDEGSNDYLITYDISSYTSLRSTIVDKFYNLDFSYNYSSGIFHIIDTYLNEMIEFSDVILDLTKGYKSIAKYNPFCFTENLFNYFTTAFTGFDNKSGMYRFDEFQEEIVNINPYIEGIGNFIFVSDSKLIQYKMNSFNCIRNNRYSRLLDIKNESGNLYNARMSDDFLNVKMLSYIINGDNLIYTDSKYLNEIDDNIIVKEGEPLLFESIINKNLQDNLCRLTLVKNDNAEFGYEHMTITDTDDEIEVTNSSIEILPVYFEVKSTVDYKLHSIGKNSNGNVHHIVDGDIGTSTVIQGFNNVLDATSINSIEDSILLINDNGDVIVYNVNDNENGTYYTSIENIDNKIKGIPLDYNFVKILSLSENLTCTILVTDNYGKFFIIPSCSITIFEDINDEISFEIDSSMTGIFKGFEVIPFELNRFNLPGVGEDRNGVVFRDYLNFRDISDVSEPITVTLANLSIDKDFADIGDGFVENVYDTYDREIYPKIFIRGNLFLIQYDNIIDICTTTIAGVPDFDPIYKIIQGHQDTIKEIKNVMINDNKVLLSFDNNTCRVIDIRRDDGISSITDNGFKNYKEYRSTHENVDYFISGCGLVGYSTDDSIYKFIDNRPVKISNSPLKKTCVDILHNRIYVIDKNNNFGFYNIIDDQYQPIRVFVTNTIVLDIVYTYFNSIEIVTSNGIYTYINDKFHKICDFEGNYGNYDMIIYPWMNYETV